MLSGVSTKRKHGFVPLMACVCGHTECVYTVVSSIYCRFGPRAMSPQCHPCSFPLFPFPVRTRHVPDYNIKCDRKTNIQTMTNDGFWANTNEAEAKQCSSALTVSDQFLELATKRLIKTCKPPKYVI